MAIEPFMLPILVELSNDMPNRKVLCLGYPDILDLPGSAWPGPDSAEAESIAKWHGWSGRVLDTDAFFDILELEPTYIDRAKIRGNEIVADLNDAELPKGFGLIIDPGTSEHIWNIGGLFAEIAQAVENGGYVVHTNPLNMGNHGFWSVNPTAYFDFYLSNGFAVEKCWELSGSLADRTYRPSSLGRFEARQNSANFFVAKKVHSPALTWPCQTKYRQNPTLKGAA